jgi:hypothetical protein
MIGDDHLPDDNVATDRAARAGSLTAKKPLTVSVH